MKVQNLANHVRCKGTFIRLHGDRANCRIMEMWTLKRNVSDSYHVYQKGLTSMEALMCNFLFELRTLSIQIRK